jgi:hypothetical protein
LNFHIDGLTSQVGRFGAETDIKTQGTVRLLNQTDAKGSLIVPVHGNAAIFRGIEPQTFGPDRQICRIYIQFSKFGGVDLFAAPYQTRNREDSLKHFPHSCPLRDYHTKSEAIWLLEDIFSRSSPLPACGQFFPGRKSGDPELAFQQ